MANVVQCRMKPCSIEKMNREMGEGNTKKKCIQLKSPGGGDSWPVKQLHRSLIMGIKGIFMETSTGTLLNKGQLVRKRIGRGCKMIPRSWARAITKRRKREENGGKRANSD